MEKILIFPSFNVHPCREERPPTKFVLFVLTEQISVEETDHRIETDEDDKVYPGSLVHTSPPHEQQPEESSELSSIEDVLDVGNRHAILAMVRYSL